MKRFLKQLVYGMMYMVFFAGLGYWLFVFFIRPPASCSDGRKNQNEEGIDCGGACANVCVPSDLRPVSVFGRVRVFPIRGTGGGDVRASILFEIQNENTGLAARSVPYRVTLYGSDGAVLGILDGSSYLYEREVKYIAMPNIAAGKEIVRAGVAIGEAVWVKANHFQKPALPIREVRALTVPEGIRAEGILVNENPVVIPEAMLTALFYDALGRVVAVSVTTVKDLAPRESRVFGIAHPFDPLIDLSRAPLVVPSAPYSQ